VLIASSRVELVNEHLEVPGTNWGYLTSTERTRMHMKRSGEEGYAHEPIRPRLHSGMLTTVSMGLS
jgi:hypothetical protein